MDFLKLEKIAHFLNQKTGKLTLTLEIALLGPNFELKKCDTPLKKGIYLNGEFSQTNKTVLKNFFLCVIAFGNPKTANLGVVG